MAKWYCKRCGWVAGKPLKGVNPRELFHRCADGGDIGEFEMVSKKPEASPQLPCGCTEEQHRQFAKLSPEMQEAEQCLRGCDVDKKPEAPPKRQGFSYACGHHTDGMIVMQGNNPLAMSAYMTWQESTGVNGSMIECFDCYLKRTIDMPKEPLCRHCHKPKGEHILIEHHEGNRYFCNRSEMDIKEFEQKRIRSE